MLLLPKKPSSCRCLATALVTLAWLLKGVRVATGFAHRLDKCEPIDIPRCRSMPYNMTRMPNLLHHSNQENSRLSIEQFDWLLDQNCSDVLLFLLCAMYVPICTVAFQPEPIPPCRSVCEKARAGCEPLMNAYNVSWPAALTCSNLPRYERGVCVSPEAIVSPNAAAKQCKCKKRKRRVQKMFRKYKYDYAVRAVVTRRKRVDANTMTLKVHVEEVLFCSKVKFPRSNHVTLWTNSSCACPKLRLGRKYLLAGHEDESTGRFLLSPSSGLAVRWREKWGPRVMRWHQQRSLKSGSRSSKGKRKSRKRGRKRKFSRNSKSSHWRKRNSRQFSTEKNTLLTNANLTRR